VQGRSYIPHPALQEYVLNIASVDAVLPVGAPPVITPYPPTPLQSIMFYGDDRIQMQKTGTDRFELQSSIVIIGPQYSRVNIMVSKKIKAIRVDFRPGALYRLLGIPMHELFDQGIPAHELLGNEINHLNEQLLNASDVDVARDAVEQYLLRKRNASKIALPIDRAITELMRTNGNTAIEKIASLACLSLRQFERKCRERVGMSPKAYARIVRFSKAYRLREARPELSWTTIANEAGYFDQMHMIRDFKEFAGTTPGLIQDALNGTPFRMQAELKT
jgi:AraC-like DNA-binding protein